MVFQTYDGRRYCFGFKNILQSLSQFSRRLSCLGNSKEELQVFQILYEGKFIVSLVQFSVISVVGHCHDVHTQ